jgi:hypothetical protein
MEAVWRDEGAERRGGASAPRVRKAWLPRKLAGQAAERGAADEGAFTFQGAARYAAWKIERHTGVAVEVTPWRERHPILAAPGVLLKVWKPGTGEEPPDPPSAKQKRPGLSPGVFVSTMQSCQARARLCASALQGSMTPRAAPISAKVARTVSICSSVWAALTLARSSGRLSGVAGGRARFR